MRLLLILAAMAVLFVGCNTSHRLDFPGQFTAKGNIPASSWQLGVDANGFPVVTIVTRKDTSIGSFTYTRTPDGSVTLNFTDATSGASGPIIANAEAIRAYVEQLEAAGKITEEMAPVLLQFILKAFGV